MSVVFINLFDVPAGRGEAFVAEWQKVNDYMRSQPGYQSHRLHRALAGDAKYQYVNVAIWESAEAWRAAHNEGFFRLVQQPQWREFPSTPALYEIVHAGEPALQ
jgi:heme-degrading monooxygenase HmoA